MRELCEVGTNEFGHIHSHIEGDPRRQFLDHRLDGGAGRIDGVQYGSSLAFDQRQTDGIFRLGTADGETRVCRLLDRLFTHRGNIFDEYRTAVGFMRNRYIGNILNAM